MNSKLPIGSVIKIKNNETKFIIIGKKVEKENTIYDYYCVKYPYGFIPGQEIYYIQDEAVETVCFIGNINY